MPDIQMLDDIQFDLGHHRSRWQGKYRVLRRVSERLKANIILTVVIIAGKVLTDCTRYSAPFGADPSQASRPPKI